MRMARCQASNTPFSLVLDNNNTNNTDSTTISGKDLCEAMGYQGSKNRITGERGRKIEFFRCYVSERKRNHRPWEEDVKRFFCRVPKITSVHTPRKTLRSYFRINDGYMTRQGAHNFLETKQCE